MSVFATSGTNDDTGKITINNAVEGETYKVYQLLVLESFDTVKKAYAYKAVPAWENWLRSQTTYLSFDGQGGYVSWKKDADPAAFAKLALAEAKELEKNRSGKSGGIRKNHPYFQNSNREHGSF